MLVESEIKKLFRQLLKEDIVHVDVNGNDVTMRVFDKNSKLFLSTPVYSGGNFIPKSVRKCLSEKLSVSRDHVQTYLTVDEERFQIFLSYLGTLDALHSDTLKILLEEFSWLADRWRDHLDERDKNDLIHVRVK